MLVDLDLVALATLVMPSGCGSSSSSPGLVRTLSVHDLYVNSVTWSPDSKYLALGASDKTVIVWEIGSGQMMNTLRTFQGSVAVVAWSPNGKYVATGSSEPSDTLRIWDATTWQEVFKSNPGQYAPNEMQVNSISWSSDSKRFAVGLQGVTGTTIKPVSWIKVYEV